LWIIALYSYPPLPPPFQYPHAEAWFVVVVTAANPSTAGSAANTILVYLIYILEEDP